MKRETYKALSWVACKCTLGTKFSSLEFFAASIASFQRLAHRHHFFPPVKPISRRLLPRDAEKSRKLSVKVALGRISCISWWKEGRGKKWRHTSNWMISGILWTNITLPISIKSSSFRKLTERLVEYYFSSPVRTCLFLLNGDLKLSRHTIEWFVSLSKAIWSSFICHFDSSGRICLKIRKDWTSEDLSTSYWHRMHTNYTSK